VQIHISDLTVKDYLYRLTEKLWKFRVGSRWNGRVLFSTDDIPYLRHLFGKPPFN